MPDKVFRLISLLSLVQHLADQWFMKRILVHIVILFLLLIVTGMILGALVIGAIYLLYLSLVLNGLHPAYAAFMVALLACVLAGGLLFLIGLRARHAASFPAIGHHLEHHFLLRLKPVADAFLDGLMTRPAPRTPSAPREPV
jgi:hypothetical protein